VATTRPSWREELLALPQARRQAVLLAHLREEAGRLAGLSADHLPSVNAGFFDLGLDSMAVVSFGAAIERELGIRAPGTLLFEYPTLAALCGHLVNMVAGAAAAPQPASTSADTTTDRVSAVEPDALAAEIAALERVLKGSAQTDRRARASRTRFTRAGR
jgi:acyl carrier protein